MEGRRSPNAELLDKKLLVDGLQIDGETVLVRADLNVPADGDRVTDATRIVATLPTIELLLDVGAAVVLMSHRGRPRGKPSPELAMAPVASRLHEELGREVKLANDSIGEAAEHAVAKLRPGGLLLLENLRFHRGEEANEPKYADQLAAHADIYVNDAFGASHRSHASVVGVPARVERAVAGCLLQHEVRTLSRVITDPRPPMVLVLGGAKVTDKVAVVTNLLPLADRVVIGGAMANAFLAAEGRQLGRSRLESGSVAAAAKVISEADRVGVELILPIDLVVAPSVEAAVNASVVKQVPDELMALDIGPESRACFRDAIQGAQTVLWNGPMGVFEVEEFASGSVEVAQAVAALDDAFTVLGGGDTAAAAAAAGITHCVSHVSTGGGASLDLLAGITLPGVDALSERSLARPVS